MVREQDRGGGGLGERNLLFCLSFSPSLHLHLFLSPSLSLTHLRARSLFLQRRNSSSESCHPQSPTAPLSRTGSPGPNRGRAQPGIALLALPFGTDVIALKSRLHTRSYVTPYPYVAHGVSCQHRLFWPGAEPLSMPTSAHSHIIAYYHPHDPLPVPHAHARLCRVGDDKTGDGR